MGEDNPYEMSSDDKRHLQQPDSRRGGDEEIHPVPGGAEQVPAEPERIGDGRDQLLTLEENQVEVAGDRVGETDWRQRAGPNSE